MGKLIVFVVILVVGGVGYYLWNQTPDTPKDATLGGYAHSLQNDEAKARAAVATSNIQTVQEAVRKYQTMKGSLPATLQDLAPEYIDHIPGGLQYDPATGTVTVVQ
jgi:hypothetical protein